METFRAFRVHTVGGRAVCKYERLALQDLDPGEVVIRTSFSAINYKDAMAARGIGKNVRVDRPCVTGVDLSGVVVRSEHQDFQAGDVVAVTNFKLGTEHDGGYAEFARVPASWIVPLPSALNAFEAMVLGTAGLTAALAVDRLERAGLSPEAGPIAVSGATGGVGSLAIDMLSRRGFEVVAISGKAGQADYLRAIGAARVVPRDEFMANAAPLVGSPPFAGAVDNVGGAMLDRLAANTRPHGKIAIAGMIQVELKSTVLPFVLRSIDVLGINVSRQLPMDERMRLWRRLATDLRPRHVDEIARPVAFERLDSEMDRFLSGAVVGRVVVEIGETALGHAPGAGRVS